MLFSVGIKVCCWNASVAVFWEGSSFLEVPFEVAPNENLLVPLATLESGGVKETMDV